MGYINSLPDGGGSSEGLEGPPGPQGPKGAQGQQGPKGDPGTGFKLASDGNFDIDGKKLLNLEVLPDAPVVGDYGDYVKDLRSGVNKEYLNAMIFFSNNASPRFCFFPQLAEPFFRVPAGFPKFREVGGKKFEDFFLSRPSVRKSCLKVIIQEADIPLRVIFFSTVKPFTKMC